MAVSYYILRMSKNNRSHNIKDLSKGGFYNPSTHTGTKHRRLCRICLNDALIPLFDNKNTQIAELINSFGDIRINVDDKEFPQHLCEICHKFINDCLLFRKVATKTDDFLRQIKVEVNIDDMQLDSPDQSDIETTESSWSDKQIEVKPEKVVSSAVKIKPAPKVTCLICNKVINRSYYKEHMTMHDPDHKKYVCDVCGKSFRLRCAYHNHSLRHRSDFPYKCQFCPYKGRYAELLKTHMKTHTGDYRYMCTECPARFLFKSNLNSHMLKHKEPQFKCDACKRAFHTKLMLQRHFEADHLGIKNHVCNLCGKAFGYRNAMMKHQRHVHKREKMLFGRMPSYLQAEFRN